MIRFGVRCSRHAFFTYVYLAHIHTWENIMRAHSKSCLLVPSFSLLHRTHLLVETNTSIALIYY